jgi:hypothetical protein
MTWLEERLPPVRLINETHDHEVARMAWLTRLTVAAAVLGVFLSASIPSQGSPAKSPAKPAEPRWWAPVDAQRMFPLRKLDSRCTGKPPISVSNRLRSDARFRCSGDRRVQPHVVERHAFDTDA